MTGLDAINAATRPEPKRDRWGRYLITTPSGKSTGHTRATTWAKTLADTWALTEWSKRVVAVGMARRPDLVALAANKTADDKDALREVIEAAEETGGANEKRRIGTALHEMLEIIDGGGTANVPAQFAPHVVAYRAALESGGVRVIPELIECIAVVDSLTVAGTFDRIVEIGDSWYIADLKTGSDPIKFGAGEIAIQTALYAHADALWNPATETREPMPQVDLTKALIIHLPAGDPTPVCTLHWVDIEAGWRRRSWPERCATGANAKTWHRLSWRRHRSRREVRRHRARQTKGSTHPRRNSRRGPTTWPTTSRAASAGSLRTAP